jgi:Protein of unknown function (DUF2726)
MTERRTRASSIRRRAGRFALRKACRHPRMASRGEAGPAWRASRDERSSCPYRRRRALLSRGELAFYRALVWAVRERFAINVKPRLADVIWCPPSLWHTPVGARIAQKHVDFVLYDRETTAIILAIELDDRSHARRERKERDAFVNEVLAACGVVLLRVAAAARYDVEALRVELEACIGRGPRRGMRTARTRGRTRREGA